MSGLDIFLILAIVAMTVVGATMGFGRAALTALALFGSLWAASASLPTVAGVVHIQSSGAANQGDVFAMLCLAFGSVAVVVAKYVHGSLGIHAGMFDAFLGLCAGVAIGMMVAHGVVRTMTIADPDGQGEGGQVASGSVSHEMLEFTSFHSVMDTVTGAGTYRRSLPNVGG
ncbi:hypothetical protein CCAX7_39340 [Capsulimonas corticalis]|uniref:Uncharacterized protein n=1 Tax=Capsulimonas corticalis TaxID=2219043 RepID=A0A402D3H7_9BACT|nr:CvpA family protein [Capsulimonas corticalis]BDI31883.1 hypothetical protein CCAX7_39340 [Capsulimonas corticalis]